MNLTELKGEINPLSELDTVRPLSTTDRSSKKASDPGDLNSHITHPDLMGTLLNIRMLGHKTGVGITQGVFSDHMELSYESIATHLEEP